MTQTETTRKSILEAASRVTAREGALNLTLEAVAKEAGVSKGGLLYHFPAADEPGTVHWVRVRPSSEGSPDDWRYFFRPDGTSIRRQEERIAEVEFAVGRTGRDLRGVAPEITAKPVARRVAVDVPGRRLERHGPKRGRARRTADGTEADVGRADR